MGVLTAEALARQPATVTARRTSYAAVSAYTLLIAITALRHEPWADEAQSWLLARDASLPALWTHLLHYEGTPGLWHTLLHILIRLGLPYAALNLFSGLLATAAIFLLVSRASLPLAVRLTLPFTYFLFYQYAVVARSYVLLPLLLFGSAVLYLDAPRRLLPLAGLLGLMAAVSVHGLVLSAAIWASLLWQSRNSAARARAFLFFGMFLLVAALLAASAWPASDQVFITGWNTSPTHFIDISLATVRESLTGETVTSFLVLAASIPFLYRGGGLLFFLAAAAMLCAVESIVYAAVWHFGILFLAWITALWIASARSKPGRLVLAALVVVIATQCYWTLHAAAADWTGPYSGSRAAARFIREAHIAPHEILGAGFSSVAIQPYFHSNVFGDNPGRPAYWDWSVRNDSNRLVRFIGVGQPRYFIAGYKAAAEAGRWADIASLGGYALSRTFPGHVLWRAGTLELESFDLYRLNQQASFAGFHSTLHMADRSAEPQLLSGFYGIESNAWRWAARTFSLALRVPPKAAESGAKLQLDLFIPDSQIAALGPLTLQARIGENSLAPQAFVQPGDCQFVRDVPASALTAPMIAVSFAFDRAMPPSRSDLRDLAAIIKSVALVKE